MAPTGSTGQAGAWITSTYYRNELPKWAQDFNDNKRAEKYLNQEWKDGNGNVLRTTKPVEGKGSNFYDLVGSTPLANDYEFEFARELITYEKLGNGPATDLLIISLSANDILGHKVGPDSAGDAGHGAGHWIGNWPASSSFSDTRSGWPTSGLRSPPITELRPLPKVAAGLHLPAVNIPGDKIRAQVNSALSTRLSHPAEYVKDSSTTRWPG